MNPANPEIRVELHGQAIIDKAIKRLEREAPEAFRKAVYQATLIAEAKAKEYQTPHVDTGRLRSSITHSVTGHPRMAPIPFVNKKTGKVETLSTMRVPPEESADKRKTQGVIGTNVKYGKHVEFKVDPYLLPAAKYAMQKLVGFMREEIRKTDSYRAFGK